MRRPLWTPRLYESQERIDAMSKTRAETAEELLVLTGTYFKRRGFDPLEDSQRYGEMYRLAVEEGLGESGPPFWPAPGQPYFKQSTGITREQSDRLLASLPGPELERQMDEAMAKHAAHAKLELEAYARQLATVDPAPVAFLGQDEPVPTMVVSRGDWKPALAAEVFPGGEVTAVPDMGEMIDAAIESLGDPEAQDGQVSPRAEHVARLHE
jgi:hypothetical protein